MNKTNSSTEISNGIRFCNCYPWKWAEPLLKDAQSLFFYCLKSFHDLKAAIINRQQFYRENCNGAKTLAWGFQLSSCLIKKDAWNLKRFLENEKDTGSWKIFHTKKINQTFPICRGKKMWFFEHHEIRQNICTHTS